MELTIVTVCLSSSEPLSKGRTATWRFLVKRMSRNGLLSYFDSGFSPVTSSRSRPTEKETGHCTTHSTLLTPV
jgi:hypothetical protein